MTVSSGSDSATKFDSIESHVGQNCHAECGPVALKNNAERFLVDGAFFFGLTERFNESIALLAWTLGLQPPCIQVGDNLIYFLKKSQLKSKTESI